MLSDEITDEALEELEDEIKNEYRKAYVDMKAKGDEYFQALDDRLEREWQSGLYTEEEFEIYKNTQIMRGERWDSLSSGLANRMVDANEVASVYINDFTPSIYALNQNYSSYMIGDAYGVDFSIYNEQAVRNLLMDETNVTEFRVTNIDRERDYEWNSKLIRRTVAQNIMQGKTLDEMAESFLQIMKRNESSALRNARTATTSAQNAGRQASYERASKMGINIKKQWHATKDGRTRDSHAHLDGEIKNWDEKYSNGLMFPADSNGRPEEVYNCRCRSMAYLPDYEDEDEYKNYGQWLEEQRNTYTVPTASRFDDYQRQSRAVSRWKEAEAYGVNDWNSWLDYKIKKKAGML